jgi:hypothetical protein
MTDKLDIYNNVLLSVGEDQLNSLSDNIETRRVLDRIWNAGAIPFCLSSGLWNFATRTVQMDADTGVTTDFGPKYIFEKPNDWIRTAAVYSDSGLSCALNAYIDEGGYWYADFETLYIKYISSDEDYGYNISKWPVNFTRFVEAYMASQGVWRITQNKKDRDDLMSIAERLLIQAQNTDAMDGPTVFPPTGSWVSARTSYGGGLTRRAGGWST